MSETENCNIIYNNEKLEQFKLFLKTATFEDQDKKALIFAVEYLKGRHENKLSSRTFLFCGRPGIGKTYIAEKFIEIFSIPVLYSGCTEINHNNLIKCTDINEILNRLLEQKDCIIFIDDLEYLNETNKGNRNSNPTRADFMKLMDLVRRSPNKIILLATTNTLRGVSYATMDRVEVPIQMDIPNITHKSAFLDAEFKTIEPRIRRFIAKESYGYCFRDLEDMIKMAYREGAGRVTLTSVKKIMKGYTPSTMDFTEIITARRNLSGVIGKESIKSELQNIVATFKKKHLVKKLGLKRHNLLIFDGAVGTGKTFVAEAFAGELDFPILNILPEEFAEDGIGYTMSQISRFSAIYEKCVVIIDEAEKLMGKGFMGDDTPQDAYLNQIFDGFKSKANAIVILIVNEINRFGLGLADRFMHIKFELPNHNERKEFLQQSINKAKSVAEVDVDFNEIARLTDGMSFRDMEKVCNNVFFKIIKGQKTVNTANFHDAIRNLRQPDIVSNICG